MLPLLRVVSNRFRLLAGRYSARLRHGYFSGLLPFLSSVRSRAAQLVHLSGYRRSFYFLKSFPLVYCDSVWQRMGKFFPSQRRTGEKMHTFREKIDKLLIINGKKIRTIEGLEDISGLGSKTLRRAYTENREPTPRTLGKLFSKLSIDPDAWYRGEVIFLGEKHTSVSEPAFKYNATATELDIVPVRIVEVKAQAGYMRGYADPEYMDTLPVIYVNRDADHKGKFMAFTVSGDSMDDGTRRALCHGDIVLGKELQLHHWQNKLHFNQYLFIVVHEEGVMFKQIAAHNPETGDFTCHSFNPQYDDFTLNIKDVKQLFYIKKIVERSIKF